MTCDDFEFADGWLVRNRALMICAAMKERRWLRSIAKASFWFHA